jgi:hypothetical protein
MRQRSQSRPEYAAGAYPNFADQATTNNERASRCTIFSSWPYPDKGMAMTMVKRHPPEMARPDGPLGRRCRKEIRLPSMFTR